MSSLPPDEGITDSGSCRTQRRHTLGIAIHDHLVIGRKGQASFRSLGLL
jgi:hypothetical protein